MTPRWRRAAIAYMVISLTWLMIILFFVARASGAQLTVFNDAGIPASQVQAAETAVKIQVNRQLRAFWTGVQPVTFGLGGWPVTLVQGKGMARQGYLGYHDFNGTSPFAVVGDRPAYMPWTVVFSHEVMEMVVDPEPWRYIGAQAVEVSDPVAAEAYRIRGVWVEDFVTPHWFYPGAPGPYDQMRQLTQPGEQVLG